MQEQEHESQGLIDKIKEYASVRKELAILSAVEKGSQLFANLLTDGLVLLFLIMTVLFGSLALGFYLSELLGNSYAGFFIITGFYFLIAVVIYLTKDKYLEKRIINSVISKIMTDKKGEDDEH